MARSEQRRGQSGLIEGAPAENFAGGLFEVSLPELGERKKGKVRDTYVVGDRRIMVTTDRQSAFDRMIGTVPDKGKVLNLLSAYWFEQTPDIVPNHMIAVPHPNVIVAHQAEQMLPVEVVLRDYMARSSTKTSVFHNYERLGRRTIYGVQFPDGLRPNERFPMGTIITPTTKGEKDEELTDEDSRRIVDGVGKRGTWAEIKKAAVALFDRGRRRLSAKGLILVDTKYEFGLDKKGNPMLVDELHTPDSSRFWRDSTYQELFEEGKTPETFDKEILRSWLAEHGFTGEGEVPRLDADIRKQMREAYTSLYTMVTERELPRGAADINTIRKAISPYLKS